MDNLDNTFVTPVFNGSASLRDAAGQMIDDIVRSVKQKKTVNSEFVDTLFDNMTALYRLDSIVVDEKLRGQGIGSDFLHLIRNTYPDALLRLEVEEENEAAVHTYKKCGFTFWPYLEMKNEPGGED